MTERSLLLVGQDWTGRWLVQENHGLIEGFFVSRDAALSFARSESLSLPGSRIEIAEQRLKPRLAH